MTLEQQLHNPERHVNTIALMRDIDSWYRQTSGLEERRFDWYLCDISGK